MDKRVLLLMSLMVVASCGSPATSGSNSVASKSNVNAENGKLSSQPDSAYTFAQNSELARDLTPSGKQAREVVGKTVTESKLWENKTFDRQLRKLMGPDYATMRKFWNVETPIRKFGDFLMMTGCEEGNCSNNQYVMFIDLGAGSIGVVHISKDKTKEWKDEDIDLPPPFVEELNKLKSRE